MKILGLSAGQPKKVEWRGKEVLTSIFKYPVQSALQVSKTGIEGDTQSDLKVHGGEDKAVYAYSYDTYEWWKNQLGRNHLEYGAFGENLTLDQLDESQIFVGDTFEAGECLLQAVQPRFPCFKLGIMYNDQKIIDTFNKFRRPGIYFRVLREGRIKAGDSFKFVSSGEKIKASILELFDFVRNKNAITKERAAELAQIQSLNEKWRKGFEEVSFS